MQYDFATQIDRHASKSLKWDSCAKAFGHDGLIPLWVADMDFKAPPAVLEALRATTEHGVFGYVQDPLPAEFFAPISAWTERRHGHRMAPERIRLAPGVVASLFSAVAAFTQPGDSVIIQPPVYPPFFGAIKQNGRTLVENPMRFENGRYTMDLEHLKSIITPATKLLILCNPHNPGCRVWTRDELEALAAVCREAGIIVVSDEIHADIVFKPHCFTPFRSVEPKSLTLYAGSKTFNISGLGVSMAYSDDADVLKAFTNALYATGYHLPSNHGLAGTLAAFEHGEEWLEALLEYLAGNAAYVRERLAGFNISMSLPEGTYLGWMDCSRLGRGQGKELAAFFMEKAGLALNSGADYGTGGAAFMRINMACSRSLLRTAMDSLERALGNGA